MALKAWPYAMSSVSVIWCKNEALKKQTTSNALLLQRSENAQVTGF